MDGPSAENDAVPLNVGACDRCGNATGPTCAVTRRNGERVTLCRDPFACWDRETRVIPPGEWQEPPEGPGRPDW